jgi:hypothetical protein
MDKAMTRVLQKAGVTPGPWAAERDEVVATRGLSSDEDDICFMNNEAVGEPWDSPVQAWPNNCRLISKAPELIEALIDMVLEAIEDYSAEMNPIMKYRNNIRTAEEYYADEISLIESALNLTWEEIQEAWNG